MKLILFFSLFAQLFGQTATRVALAQIQAVPGAASGTVTLVLPSGQVTVVDLGPCFTVVAGSGTAHATLQFNASGPGCVPGVPQFSDAETPSGAVNGTNAAFTLAFAPAPALSLQLSRNGVLQRAGNDYTITGNAITFVAGAVPQTGDSLMASYRH